MDSSDSNNTETSKSNSLYRYVHSNTYNTGKMRTTLEKMLIDGDKGLSIKFFKRNKVDDKDTVLKVTIKEVGPDKFGVRVKKNDVVDEKEFDTAKLKKFLSENKDMDYALDYINKEMKKFRENKKKAMDGGARKKRKSSKRKSSKRKSSKRRTSKRKTSKRKSSKRKSSKRKSSKRKSTKRKSSNKR